MFMLLKPDVFAIKLFEHFFRDCILRLSKANQLPVETNNLIGEFIDHINFVRNKHDRCLMNLIQMGHDIIKAFFSRQIHFARRLVEQKKDWLS